MDFIQNSAIIIIFIFFSLSFLIVISNWKIYTKAGQPGWASIIPVYNFVVLLEIVEKPAWWIILFFIPIVNIIVYFIVLYNLVKAFGKDEFFAIGLILLPFIFYPVLAYGENSYVQPTQVKINVTAAEGSMQTQPGAPQTTKNITKKSNLLLIILLIILIIILAGIANHYIRIKRGCPYNNRKIHYSFNTGCSLTDLNSPFNDCTYDGTCKRFGTPSGWVDISARPIQEIILQVYTNIDDSGVPINLHNLFGDIRTVNQQAISFTYYFTNKKLIEKVQPFDDNSSIYKEVEVEPILTNKDGVNFYKFVNRYCAAGDVYSVCFQPSQNTLESEKEIVEELKTFKFN